MSHREYISCRNIQIEYVFSCVHKRTSSGPARLLAHILTSSGSSTVTRVHSDFVWFHPARLLAHIVTSSSSSTVTCAHSNFVWAHPARLLAYSDFVWFHPARLLAAYMWTSNGSSTVNTHRKLREITDRNFLGWETKLSPMGLELLAINACRYVSNVTNWDNSGSSVKIFKDFIQKVHYSTPSLLI